MSVLVHEAQGLCIMKTCGPETLKKTVAFCKGGTTFPGRLVENHGSVLKGMSFLDQDV